MFRPRANRRIRGVSSGALVALAVAVAVSPGCDRSGGRKQNSPTATPPDSVFVDVTRRVGLDFVSVCGPDRTYFMPEIMGSDCALLDFDNDGDLDIYLINAGFPPSVRASAADAPRNRLFRHEDDHTFTDVTAGSGLDDPGYGMGVAVGDIDNDGLVDVYVTNYGPNRLFKNLGGGRFEDVTARAGVGDGRWGTR